MIKRIKTGLRASLFTAVLFSILLAASVGALAAKGTGEINCFFERPGAVSDTDVPEEGEKDAVEVIPGGIPFGVKLFVGGPVADGYAEIGEDGNKSCPAKDAGIKKGDVITEVNGVRVTSAEDVVRQIGQTG